MNLECGSVPLLAANHCKSELSQDLHSPAATTAGVCVSGSDDNSVFDSEFEAEPQGVDIFEPAEIVSDTRSEPDHSLKLETRGVTSHGRIVKQGVLWEREIVFQQSILAKLNSIGKGDLAGKMQTCHTVETWKVCNGCKRQSKFFNRCELFFCPVCQPRLSRERKESIEWWTKQINQPKHIVLTVRNTMQLTKSYVQFIKKQFGKLRRQNVFSSVRGGFYSLEITNEGKGWHLHLHVLCDARWIQASSLAIVWGKLVGQDYAIVKVKDARGNDYLREVTKYAVKGNQLASWSGEEIAEFINAFSGVRTFGVFGSLYGKRTEWSEWIKSVREIKPLCVCGCDSWRLLSSDELEWEQTVEARPPPKRPVQVSNNQCELSLGCKPHFAFPR